MGAQEEDEISKIYNAQPFPQDPVCNLNITRVVEGDPWPGIAEVRVHYTAVLLGQRIGSTVELVYK